MRPRVVLAAIMGTALIAGCTDGWSSASPTPVPDAPTGSARTPESGHVVATDDRLKLTVSFEPIELEPGGELQLEVTVENIGTTPVLLKYNCGFVEMVGLVPVPVEPVGRVWDGIAGKFKAYALKQGLGPIDHPESTSVSTPGRARCDVPFMGTLEPGASTPATLKWKAELVEGIPVRAAGIPISVTVQGQIPDDPQLYERLSVDGMVRVVGDPPPMVSAGEAIDAILSHQRFATWLSKQPMRTWDAVHVALVDYRGAGGNVPEGPSWEIDLYREVKGKPRQTAIGYVDPITGTVRLFRICNGPCFPGLDY